MDTLENAIKFCFEHNPDTLMPLLLLTLATQRRLAVKTQVQDGETVFAAIDAAQVLEYDWCRYNPALKKRLKGVLAEGGSSIYVTGALSSELKDIFNTFHHYDTVTVVQEYHHRRGRLVFHTENIAANNALRQYATIVFAEKLLLYPERIRRDFLALANQLLVESGIQPRRPRIKVAEALRTLLKYDGKGVVYNPFGGCALAAAMIHARKDLYIDGDVNEKILAISRLLCHGVGSQRFNIEKRDSTKWLQGPKPDYVLSTYLGYPGGKSAFDLCLSHCLDDFSGSGRYAGIAAPRDIFEKRSPEMEEALRRDWVDTIVLLPFGEVAILINAAKPSERRNSVLFFNLTHPALRSRPIAKVLGEEKYAMRLNLSDVRKKVFLKELVQPEIEPREGFDIVTFGDLFEKMPRKTWSLSRVSEEDKVLAYIDRNTPYDRWAFPWMQGIKKEQISDLFTPAYKLDDYCLIVNARGMLEPRMFDTDQGNAFFQDGFAFRITPFAYSFDLQSIIRELNEPYVVNQLHPYGLDEMVPEPLTEDAILNLKLYLNPEEEEEEEEEIVDHLETGRVFRGDQVKYTIHEFLGNGNFGYAYSAMADNLITGEKKEVVLKEFYPTHNYHRENGKVVPNSEEDELKLEDDRMKFRKEAEIMGELGRMPESHIVPALDFFESEETGTMYYVMPFYKEKSFDDFLVGGGRYSEELAIQHAAVPLCKALNASQKKKVLHLDIKPENILIDENGDAVLTDFGTAKEFDDSDIVIFRGGLTPNNPYSAPELREGSLTKYDPRPDLFSIAGVIYTLITRQNPFAIMELDKDGEDYVRGHLRNAGCSESLSDAIVKGLQGSMSLRPKNAQAFLNLFPGCEDMKLN